MNFMLGYITWYPFTRSINVLQIVTYTLSHLENDLDVSAYSGRRCLLSRAQLVYFLIIALSLLLTALNQRDILIGSLITTKPIL